MGSHQHPSVTVDVVLLARGRMGWQVMLIRRKHPPFEGHWALPGGFVEPGEPLESAARRELLEEAGVEPSVMDQLHTFGDPGRDPRGWTISVAFLAILDADERLALRPKAGDDAADVGWFDLAALPPLAFDHADILACARRHVS
jgi:8-oxo-dGTP diphosphatase